MSIDKSTEANDLSLDLEDTADTDSSADDAERSEDDTEDEVGADLDLEPNKGESDDKASKREAAAEQHARSYAAKILTRKATLADIPANHQYLIPKVKALLGLTEEKVEKKSSNAEVMSIVRFESLKERIKSVDRTAAQNKELQTEFNVQLAAGLAPDVALEKARKYAGISLEEKADMPKIKTGGSAPAGKVKYTGNEDTTTMSRKQLADFISAQPRSRR